MGYSVNNPIANKDSDKHAERSPHLYGFEPEGVRQDRATCASQQCCELPEFNAQVKGNECQYSNIF